MQTNPLHLVIRFSDTMFFVGYAVSLHKRRTFATMSLKAGMNPLHFQGLLGHASMEMTKRYVQMVDDDLITAHKEHGPIDNLLGRSGKN